MGGLGLRSMSVSLWERRSTATRTALLSSSLLSHSNSQEQHGMLSTREEPLYFCFGSVFPVTSCSALVNLYLSVCPFLIFKMKLVKLLSRGLGVKYQCAKHSAWYTANIQPMSIPFSLHRNTFPMRIEVSRKFRWEILVFTLQRIFQECICFVHKRNISNPM